MRVTASAPSVVVGPAPRAASAFARPRSPTVIVNVGSASSSTAAHCFALSVKTHRLKISAAVLKSTAPLLRRTNAGMTSYVTTRLRNSATTMLSSSRTDAISAAEDGTAGRCEISPRFFLVFASAACTARASPASSHVNTTSENLAEVELKTA